MDTPWRLIPASEVRPSLPPADVRARGWFREAIERVRGDDAPAVEPTPSEDLLGPLEEARLAQIAPEPPIAAQRAAFDSLLGRTNRALVLRPDDGGWDAVLDEETPGGSERIEPAAAGTVVAALPLDLERRLADPAPLHLARLERWFVRHHAGLDALRQLLRALRDRKGSWSADVGPWAWAWMWHALGEARILPAPWAPAPLDGDALAGWLGTGAQLRLRRDGQPPDAAVFRALAARSLGEAGSALAVWRACLRDGAERAQEEAAAGHGDGDRDGDRDDGADDRTVWVRHPSAVELPSLTSAPRIDLLVVHAILLHGGATVARLTPALAAISERLEGSLARLASQGIVEQHDGETWTVAAQALPAVRGRLGAEAFAGSVA